MNLRILFFFSLTFLLGACGSDFLALLHGSKSSNQTAASADIYKVAYRWDGQHQQSALWSRYTAEAIDEFKVFTIETPADITNFCPTYHGLSEMERRQFWIYLFSSMTQLESSFNPNAFYQENFKDNSGEFIVSRGLLQLSIESSQGYGCPLETAQELHDPWTNLNCGVRIFANLLARDKTISGQSGTTWLGAARYWAVLRNQLAQIQEWTQTMPICQ